MWVLIKRIKNAILKETEKAVFIKVYDNELNPIRVWLPKYSFKKQAIKGYFCIKERIAIEKNLKYESPIKRPDYLNPSKANICNEFYD